MTGVLFQFEVDNGVLKVTVTTTDSYRLAQAFLHIEFDDRDQPFTEAPDSVLVSAVELKNSLKTVRSGAWAVFEFTDGELAITVSKAGVLINSTLAHIKGEYPKFERFFDDVEWDAKDTDRTGPTSVHLNPTYFGQIGTMLGVGKSGIPIHFIMPHDDKTPIGMTFTVGGVMKSRGLLMRVRV